MKRWSSFILALLLILSLPSVAFAKTPFSENSKAIATAAESVLMLTCYDSRGNIFGTGSGFLAIEDGIIITNYHVIEGNVASVKANTEDGMYFDIDEILCYDATADIAILSTKARTRLNLLKLGDSDKLSKASEVVAIGSPLGLVNTVSKGVYSGIIFDDTDYILFTAAISSGSSGGALFNDNGEVIGITSASYQDAQNLNLAVPINSVKELWNNYKNGTYITETPSPTPVPTSRPITTNKPALNSSARKDLIKDLEKAETVQKACTTLRLYKINYSFTDSDLNSIFFSVKWKFSPNGILSRDDFNKLYSAAMD